MAASTPPRYLLPPLPSTSDLEQLYLRYSRVVYQRARQLLLDDDAARDATQEVFMRFIRAGGKLPAEPTPTAWLYCVTTNLCLNQLRDKRRQLLLLTRNHEADTAVAPNGETRATLLQILERVPEELQAIAVYFFLDELTYGEIGRLLDVSPRTVCTRLTAFREQLERMFPKSRLAS